MIIILSHYFWSLNKWEAIYDCIYCFFTEIVLIMFLIELQVFIYKDFLFFYFYRK